MQTGSETCEAAEVNWLPNCCRNSIQGVVVLSLSSKNACFQSRNLLLYLMKVLHLCTPLYFKEWSKEQKTKNEGTSILSKFQFYVNLYN